MNTQLDFTHKFLTVNVERIFSCSMRLTLGPAVTLYCKIAASLYYGELEFNVSNWFFS